MRFMKNKKGAIWAGIMGWLSSFWPILLIAAVFIGLIYLAYTQSPAEIPESDIENESQPTSELLPGADDENSCGDVTGLPFSSTSYLSDPGSNPEYLSGYSVCIDECIDAEIGTWKSYEFEKGDEWCLELNMDSDHSEYIKCCAYCPQETHYSPISKSCKLDSDLEDGLKLECPYITLSWDKDEKAISYEIIPFYDENKDEVEDGKCEEDISNTKERYFYYNLESSGCAAYYTGNVRFQIIPQYSDSLSIESYDTGWIDVSVCNIGSIELTEPVFENYPSFLIKNNELNAIVVVGDNSPPEDSIAAADILLGLSYYNGQSINLQAAVLSSKVSNPRAQNMILIGRPTKYAGSESNPLIDDFSIPSLSYGDGLLKIADNGNYVAVIVTARNKDGIRKVAEFLKNYNDHTIALKGTEVRISYETSEKTCTDSDGGKNYYTKGTLTYEGIAREDVCIVEDVPGDHSVLLPADKCEGDNCFINEYVCEGPTFKKYNDFNCPNGCEDGACICDMVDTLAEGESKTYTIGGLDYDVKAIITTSIYPYHVQFVVNGELTGLLETGNAFTLSNGAGIAVIEILPNEAGNVTEDLVEFCLNGEN